MKKENVLPPFLNFKELDFRSDWEFPDALQQIQDRKIDGFWIRNVLTPGEVAKLVGFVDGVTDEEKVLEQQGWVFPVGFAAAVENSADADEAKEYFSEMKSFRENSVQLFGFDFISRVEGILSKLNGKIEVNVPEGLNQAGAFTPVQVRRLYHGHPGIPIHCGNVFKQMYPGYYDLLSEKVDALNQMSFFMVLQKPDAGGELTVYDLEWEEGQGMVNFEEMQLCNGEVVNPGQDQRFKKWKIPSMVGDLFVFSGGQIWHRVEPIMGETDRITIAGFFAFSHEKDIVYHWA